MMLGSRNLDMVAHDVSPPGLPFDGLTSAQSARTAIIDAATGTVDTATPSSSRPSTTWPRPWSPRA